MWARICAARRPHNVCNIACASTHGASQTVPACCLFRARICGHTPGRDKQTYRETEGERERARERERERGREREGDLDRETEGQKDKDRETERQRGRK